MNSPGHEWAPHEHFDLEAFCRDYRGVFTRGPLTKQLDALVSHVTSLRSEVARLRAALEWFADEGHYSDTYRRCAGYVDVHGLGVARRALLGLGDDDEYEDAWSARAALSAYDAATGEP